MPHIRIRSMSSAEVQELSGAFSSALSEILNSPEEHFTCERVETEFFYKGKPTQIDPFIEVLWFNRGQSLKDLSAKKMTEIVQQKTKYKDVTVVFQDISKTDYYENAKHFGH